MAKKTQERKTRQQIEQWDRLAMLAIVELMLELVNEPSTRAYITGRPATKQARLGFYMEELVTWLEERGNDVINTELFNTLEEED